MRSKRVWGQLLGVEQVVVEAVRVEPLMSLDEGAGPAGAAVVVSVRPTRWWRGRCGRCGRRCSGYDRGRGVRWWRTFDVGLYAAFLEAPAPRVRCPQHGVTVAAVPWARHGAGHTRAFDDLVAWFATRMSKTALARYLRVGWATVGVIIARVMADVDAQAGDRLAGITRIGVDEISYKRGFKFLQVTWNQPEVRSGYRPFWAVTCPGRLGLSGRAVGGQVAGSEPTSAGRGVAAGLG